MKIEIVFADRHPRICKLMTVNPLFNDIKHQFYPWHAAEGICKSLDFTNFTPKSDFSIHEKKKHGKAVAMDTINPQPLPVER